ncbi:dickkopf-related protein 4 [Sphaerodactylus townsendi]|uniref:dickkopf-related protein 4 n=1 Tax=Sphaerodactylus townsendi TaxID=933632 RepID=UPI0020269B6A|nr:dickkopf-related protein 4 [Sphaerodactylus townsendi]
MEAALLLGITCFCSSLAAMVLDFNTIRGSAEVTTSKKSAQCLTDKDCHAGKFCHKPWEELPYCSPCHRLRRRCQRNAMCCPGTLCINDVCTQIEKMTRVDEKKHTEQVGSVSKGIPHHPVQERNTQKKENTKTSNDAAQEGESCLRTSDCSPGLCCARHYWTKICKPVLTEGQACSKRGQKDGAQGPEIFQRCDCGPGLSCQPSRSRMTQSSRLRECVRN